VLSVFRSTSSTVDSKVIISAGIYDKIIINFYQVLNEEFFITTLPFLKAFSLQLLYAVSLFGMDSSPKHQNLVLQILNIKINN